MYFCPSPMLLLGSSRQVVREGCPAAAAAVLLLASVNIPPTLALYFTVNSVQNILYSVYCAVYTVQCTVCTVVNVQCYHHRPG